MQKFQLTTTELRTASEFLTKHEELHGPNEIHHGPRYLFEVVNCGIGTGTAVRCNTCKECLDITDYDVW